MKILVGCRLPDTAISELRSLGTTVLYEPDITTERLEQLVGDAAILVVCRTRVSPEVISAAKALQMIVRSGTDVANIAIEEASAAGVFVVNCPNQDAVAVAEMILGLLLAIDRRPPAGVEQPPSVGLPPPPKPLTARGMAGSTLGVLGFGAAERELAKRARALGMRMLVWSPSLSPENAAENNVELCAWPRELARRSDMVAVYAPKRDVDDVLVNAEFLENMRIGAYLAYVGHPASLDETALVSVATARNLRVGYDISAPTLTESNAVRLKSRLQSLPNVLGTYGLADRTKQAWEATATEVVRVIRSFLVSGEVRNCVNLMEHSPATWQLVLRLRDTVGVLAAIMQQVREDGINAEEICSRVFTGAQAAWCIISLDERPSAEGLNAIRELDGVLHLELRALM